MTILVVAMARPESVIGVPRFEGPSSLRSTCRGAWRRPTWRRRGWRAAKAAARTFVASQPKSIQIGVVAFSDAGFSVTVPTDDQSAVLAAIDRLGPERGTSIARGILSSMTAIATADRIPRPGTTRTRHPTRTSCRRSSRPARSRPLRSSC
jgi:Ca-activated chloride channel family protein